MNFSKRLKQQRVEKGWNQEECASTGGVSISTQKNYERGKGAPDLLYLQRLHEAGIDVKFIITGEPSPDPVRALGVVLRLADHFDLSGLEADGITSLSKYIYSSGSRFEDMRAAFEATGAKKRASSTGD